jgi:hypothetical protein
VRNGLLKGIDPLLTPELLNVLRSAGHGKSLVHIYTLRRFKLTIADIIMKINIGDIIAVVDGEKHCFLPSKIIRQYLITCFICLISYQ